MIYVLANVSFLLTKRTSRTIELMVVSRFTGASGFRVAFGVFNGLTISIVPACISNANWNKNRVLLLLVVVVVVVVCIYSI